MADEQAALEADPVEQFRQHLAGLALHVIERPRQRHRARGAIAGARIGKYGGAGGLLKLVGEIAPQADGAEAFMQQHNAWCI